MTFSPITSWQLNGETMGKVTDFILGGSKITVDGYCSHEIKRCLFLERKVMTNLDSVLKSRAITLSTKIHLVKTMVFPVAMYRCERSTIEKGEHWRADLFELWCHRRLESLLDCKEIKPVNPKRNQSWIFIGRTDAEVEQYFGCLMWRTDSLEKTLISGKDWRQQMGMTEDEMVGWHHWLNGQEFEQALGAGDGKGSLACFTPWSHRVRHKEQPNCTELRSFMIRYLLAQIRGEMTYILVYNKIDQNKDRDYLWAETWILIFRFILLYYIFPALQIGTQIIYP